MAYPESPVQPLSCLEGQANGRLGNAILVRIPGQLGGATITLCPPAARSWRAMAGVARAAGHVLKTSLTWQSYRSYAEQVAVFRDHYTLTRLPGRPTRNWQGQTYYLRPGKSTAAVPGTSKHGWARAVDTGEERDGDPGSEPLDNATLQWLIANARLFGFSWEIQSEPWHLIYFAGDTPPLAVRTWEAQRAPFPPPKPPTLPPTPPEDDDDMAAPYALWRFSDSPRVYCVSADDVTARHVGDPEGLKFSAAKLRLGGYDATVHVIDVANPAHEQQERWLRELLADAKVPTV